MPRQLHKSGIKFSFEDESPPASKVKKEAKKGRFNFNDFSDEDEQENQPVRSKQQNYMNTLDTLNDKTDLLQQVQSILVPSNTRAANLAKTTQQIEKVTKKDKEIMEQWGVKSYIHAEEGAYIEQFFKRLLKQEEDRQLHELAQQPKFTANDRFAKEEVLMHLLATNILNGKLAYTVNNAYTYIDQSSSPNGDTEEHLKKWAIFALRRQLESSKFPSEKNVSQEWLMLAENKIQQLVKRFTDEQNYDEAILVTCLQDKAFSESYEINTSKALKKEYAHLQSKNIKITPNTAWIVDFAIVIQYFDASLIHNYLFDICKKYQATSSNAKSTLLSSLVALTLHFSKGQETPQLERVLEKIILQEKRLCYLDQILYLHTLRQYKSKYRRLFNRLTQSLVTKIQNPELFVDLMEYSQLTEDQIKTSINLLLEKNPNISGKREQSIQALFAAIDGKNRAEGLQSKQAEILNNWMQCQKYLRLVANKKHTEAALFYSEAYPSIKASKIHSFKHLNESLIKNLVKFELACSYKQAQRSEYYRILHRLKTQLEGDHNTTIIQGCMAFVQLKANAVWFGESNHKLQNLYGLFDYLKDLRSDKGSAHNANCFLANIRKTLEKLLLSLDGQIYLARLAGGISDEKERENLVKGLKKQVRQREINADTVVSKSAFFKLLEMVDWNESIVNFIAVKLLFL